MSLPPRRIAILDDYQGTVAALPCWARIAGRVQVDTFRDTLDDEDALAARLATYAVIVTIRERTGFSPTLLARLPALELLALTGRSSGQVDVAAATAAGVLVTETDGSAAGATELTIGLIVALARRIPHEDRALRAGRWQTGVGVELGGRTLGVVGLGRIGGRVAAFGKLLGMQVLAWGPTLTAERAAAAGAAFVPLDELLAASDVVTLHLRLSDRTRGLIDAARLARLKRGALLVNTARAALVDETALLAALRDGRLGGAALDVYEVEPLPVDHALVALDNVVLTPHIGFVTAESYRVFFDQVVDSVEVFLDGGLPSRAINPEARSIRRS